MEIIEAGISRKNFEATVKCTNCTAKLKIEIDDVHKRYYEGTTFSVRCGFCHDIFELDYDVIPGILYDYIKVGNPPYSEDNNDYDY